MHKINYYKNKFSRYHTGQGSIEWLDGRKYSFGGSEIATVLDKNTYDTFESLIERKKTKENVIKDETEWGHLFEPIAKTIITQKYGKIFEFTAIPLSTVPICYSPDGLLLTEDQNDIQLLEIKCPIRRGIKDKEGKARILESYKLQVLCGMEVFNCKSCLFAQYRFRRCTLNTFPTSSNYDRTYHLEFRKRCPDMKPITFGYLHWENQEPLLDLATVPEITKYIKKGMKYNTYIGEKKTFKFGYVLMWKLFEEVYEHISREDDFLNKYETILWDKYKLLDDLISNELKENIVNVTPEI